MILVVNYADEKFAPFQKLQTQTAYYFGADKVREYSPKNIDGNFYQKNKFILDQPRGAGYWLWKPYIIKDALNSVNEGDYVFYVDSGAFFVNKIKYLTDTMEQQKANIMLFSSDINTRESTWTKRDAFILMDCDNEKYVNSTQIGASFVLFKKCAEIQNFVDEWLKFSQDARIITDIPNQLGKENYPDFKENRHDQTVLSLLAKKKNFATFRTPSQFGEGCREKLSEEILKRSTYPKILYHHRRAITFQKTLEDFFRIYGNAPRLCEGVRSAKFLIEEGLTSEAYKLLWNLTEKYREGNDSAWINTWDDLLVIIEKHKEIGAPYAEIFQPLLCKMLLQVIRRGINFLQFPQLIRAAEFFENKSLIPQEFQDVLIKLSDQYIELSLQKKLPLWSQSHEIILNNYLSLKMPDTPLKQNFIEKYKILLGRNL